MNNCITNKNTEKYENFYIYIIMDPRTEKYSKENFSLPHTPIYVGKGKNRRFKQPKNKTFNNYTKNLELKYIILEFDNESIAYENEEYFIELFGRVNKNTGPLLNVYPGGRFNFGFSGNPAWNKGINHSEETKKKISEKALGRRRAKYSTITRKKISDKISSYWNNENNREIRKRISREKANMITCCCKNCKKELTNSTKGNHYKYCKGSITNETIS